MINVGTILGLISIYLLRGIILTKFRIIILIILLTTVTCTLFFCNSSIYQNITNKQTYQSGKTFPINKINSLKI